MGSRIATEPCGACGQTVILGSQTCPFCGNSHGTIQDHSAVKAPSLPVGMVLAAAWWVFDGLRTAWAGGQLSLPQLSWLSAGIRIVGIAVAIIGIGIALRWETAYDLAPAICFEQAVFGVIEGTLAIMLSLASPTTAILLLLSVTARFASAIYVWRTLRDLVLAG